jgi:hypothetical protein
MDAIIAPSTPNETAVEKIMTLIKVFSCCGPSGMPKPRVIGLHLQVSSFDGDYELFPVTFYESVTIISVNERN